MSTLTSLQVAFPERLFGCGPRLDDLDAVLRALEADDGVRKVGVHAHAGPEAEGQVGPQRHDERRDEGRHGGREDEALEVEAGDGEDVGVDSHDVGGGEEGRAARAELGGHVGAALGHLRVWCG